MGQYSPRAIEASRPNHPQLQPSPELAGRISLARQNHERKARNLPGLELRQIAASVATMESPRPVITRSLFSFAIFYGGMVCIAGVLGNKQVSLGPLSSIGTWFGTGPLAVEAGIFAFLMLVAVSSAVAELHGRATANRLVQIGFVPLIMALLLSLLVYALPASAEMTEHRPETLAAIQGILFSTWRIWIGGIVAYGISQTLNVTIFAALKGDSSSGGRMLWFRAAVAGVLSQAVDTVVFVFIAFYGEFDISTLLVGQMLAKVTLSIILVPLLIYIFVALGRALDGRKA